MQITLISVLMFISLKSIKNKLNLLMILEILMLLLISSAFNNTLADSNSLYLMMIFSIFMVTDSVFGISLLIYNSRNSTINSFLVKN